MTPTHPSKDGGIWLLDFAKGEHRQITAEEHRRMVLEMQARTVVKNGVVYIDCQPKDGTDG